MEWKDLKKLIDVKRDEIYSFIDKIKSNTTVDVSIEATLGAIPVVGQFLSTYWSRIGNDKDTQALESVARALDSMAQSEEVFKEASELMKNVGATVEQNAVVLDMVATKLTDMKPHIDLIAEATKNRFVKDALSVSVSLIGDHKRRAELISVLRETLGRDFIVMDLLSFGMILIAKNQLEFAEACLLEYHEQNPDETRVLVELATLYQRRAHEYVIQRNYGFAEEVLKKAQSYVKAADTDVDIGVDLQLAYGYKEIAQSYIHAAYEVPTVLKKARQRFGGVLAVEPENASALCGYASLYTIEGNYKQAIEYLQRAVAIEPRYIEAWSDLAQVCMAQASRFSRLEKGVEFQRLGRAAYERVKTLLDEGLGLPGAVVKQLEQVFGR